MNKHFDIVQETLLKPAELTMAQLEKVLNEMLLHKLDYADLYFQASHVESWRLEDTIVKDASYHIDRGIGVRGVSGEKSGLSYTNDISIATLIEAADASRNIVTLGGGNKVQVVTPVKGLDLYKPLNPLDTLSEADKINFLREIDQEARKQDPRVSQVMVGLSGVYETILIMASDGTLAADVRPLVRLNVSVIVEEKNRREHGFCGGGARTGYDFLFDNNKRALNYAKEAVREALINLEAIEAPAGIMPVVLGPGWPGVLLHEAIGHGLEGDFNRKGSSIFAGKIGEKVASSVCTVVDNGALNERRGSLNIDDEGVLAQNTVLIENGILKGYMFDKMNARLMGTSSTGNARRESYAHLPVPRMTNTYMLPGEYVPEEIIASVDKGLYAVNFGGGQVDITSGKFVFSASVAYLIEKGKVTAPVKGATLIGNGPEVLHKVSMVGNDLEFDFGVGICGKDGQSVPVGVGQPTLKVDELTVGGTG
jgi:TldD protein